MLAVHCSCHPISCEPQAINVVASPSIVKLRLPLAENKFVTQGMTAQYGAVRSVFGPSAQAVALVSAGHLSSALAGKDMAAAPAGQNSILKVPSPK